MDELKHIPKAKVVSLCLALVCHRAIYASLGRLFKISELGA